MSTQSSAAKPSLQGVRIKARKGAVKAQAKHEPAVFRDQLYKHLETVPEGDFDGFTNKLVQAGSTLEFLKYSDALFEILLVGGLIQPGGSYVDDGAPVSPFTIFHSKDPVDVSDLKKYVEVFNKLIRRYKYLQKPLEENSLPGLLQYIHRWSPVQQQQLAMTTGLLISQGLAVATCLQALTKDHLIKNDVAIKVLTFVFRAYLVDQSMEHLQSTLKKGGIRDLSSFFPVNKRDNKTIEGHFRKEGLSQVADYWAKKQYNVVKEGVIQELSSAIEANTPTDQIVMAIRERTEENSIPESELVQCIWQGLMSSIDLSARPDQIEGLALREVTKYAPVLQPFCDAAKTQIALINVVQVHCYEDTRVIKAFSQILKVLYNTDCISDQAIIYWYQKGSKPQGRQHFLKNAEPLVKFLQEDDDDESEEE